MNAVNLPEQFQNLEKPQSDGEVFDRMIALKEALESGVITEREQVEAVLKTFGAYIGPLGCLSNELEKEKSKLDRSMEERGMKKVGISLF